jgi:hypothetical protein
VPPTWALALLFCHRARRRSPLPPPPPPLLSTRNAGSQSHQRLSWAEAEGGETRPLATAALPFGGLGL